MNALHYRFAMPHDAPLLARLNTQLIEEGADFGPADLVYLEKRMRRWLNSGHDRAVLFEDQDGRLVAYAVYQEHAREIYLRQFLVLNAARHHGLGRQAFQLLRSEIWSPRKRLTLEVLSSNQAGYRFWRSLGYRNCAVTLEIPASTAEHPVQSAERPRRPHGTHTRVLAAAIHGASPLRLVRSLRAFVRSVANALSRRAPMLALAVFVSTPAAASAAAHHAPIASAAPIILRQGWIAAHAPRETRGYLTRVQARAARYTLAIGSAHAALAQISDGVDPP